MTRAVSKRGMPLLRVCTQEGNAPEIGVITAECYVKWYELYVILADGSVSTINFTDLEEYTEPNQSAYVDHVPNPTAIEVYAEVKGYEVDAIFLEVAVGRWLMEVRDVDVKQLSKKGPL